MASTEYASRREVARVAKLEATAEALDADAWSLASEIDRRKRDHAPRREAVDVGYGIRPEDRRAPMARDASPAAEAMREVARVIPATADACVTLKGAEVLVTRVVRLASSEALEARYARCIRAEAEAEAGLTQALKRARAFADHSAAQARVSAAATATAKARRALEAARELVGASEWEACERTETIYRAHWSKSRPGIVKRDVVPLLATRRDVMPLGMGDALRPDPDRAPSDPVGERVVGGMVDWQAQHAVAAEWLEAVAEFAREVVRASDDAAMAEAARMEA